MSSVVYSLCWQKQNQTSDVSLLGKTTNGVSVNGSCLRFLTQHASFCQGCLLFRDWSYRSKSSGKEWITASTVVGFKHWQSGLGEKWSPDIMLWFTHTGSALLSEISHKVNSKILLSCNLSWGGLAGALQKTGQYLRGFVRAPRTIHTYITLLSVVPSGLYFSTLPSYFIACRVLHTIALFK